FLAAEGSHGFQTLVNEVATSQIDPETKATVLERRRAKLIVDGLQPGATEDAKRLSKLLSGGARVPLAALGSGSDYTVFLDHLGIPSLNIYYGGENDTDGIYHSAYDSFDHYTRFGDPDFAYGVMLARTNARVALRAANADLLPIHCTDFAEAVAQY